MKCVRSKFLEISAVAVLLLEQCLVLNRNTPTLSFVDEESNWRGFLNLKRLEKEDRKAGKIFSGKLGNKKEGNNGIQHVRRDSEKRYCKKLESVSLGSFF